MSIINERIKTRRQSLNMTLLELAEAVGVRDATVQRYESGAIKNISHEMICKLSEALKCTPSYLMGWAEKPEGHLTERTEIETDNPTINRLLGYMLTLNDAGREKLLERAEELEQLPQYGTRDPEEEKRWQ